MKFKWSGELIFGYLIHLAIVKIPIFQFDIKKAVLKVILRRPSCIQGLIIAWILNFRKRWLW